MTEQSHRKTDFCVKAVIERAVCNLPAAEYGLPDGRAGETLCPAAVLVPVIDRGREAKILLTRRADDHPHHAGQISFPGGRIAPDDKDAESAALRETFEETGIDGASIDLLGRFDNHRTGTGFVITPLLGIVTPPFDLHPCAREVAEIFEVPLSFVMDKRHYRVEQIMWRGRPKSFYVIDYGPYRIWGATAAMLKQMQERLYG